MDRAQKLQYQKDAELYLENKKVYEIFEDMIQSLIVHQPTQPIEYLIQKLSKPQPRKIFLVGPPGSNAREIALALSDHLNFNCLIFGDLLKKEIQKKSQESKMFEEHMKSFTYVPDEAVVDMLKKHLASLETQSQHILIEGFPKTKYQCQLFQKLGIFPDCFIILNYPQESLDELAKKKFDQDELYSSLRSEERKQRALDYSLLYQINIAGVKEASKNYYFQVDARGGQNEILQDCDRLVRYRIKSKSLKRSQKVFILGPPGSGRSTIAKSLSQRYGFALVSTEELLTRQIEQKTELGEKCLHSMNAGDLLPDDIMSGLLETRLDKSDCNIFGFVLEGFPKTNTQIQILQNLKIQPNLIVVLECPDEEVRRRLENKKIDPDTGKLYSSNSQTDPSVAARLIPVLNQAPEAIKKRLERWDQLLKHVEETYYNCILKVSSLDPPHQILEKISYHIENSQKQEIKLNHGKLSMSCQNLKM